MSKEQILNELINKANNIKDTRKKELILLIFKNSNWYNEVDADMFYSLLKSLNYNINDIKKIYNLLFDINDLL